MLTSRGLGRVLGDLASMGFDAKWGVLGAANVGANHQRDRIWIVARQSNVVENTYGPRMEEHRPLNTNSPIRPGAATTSEEPKKGGNDVAYATSIGQQGQRQYEQPIYPAQVSDRQANYAESIGRPDFWSAEPNVDRVADGVAARVDRLKAIGNGQVSLCAATAWRLLK